LQWRAGEYRVEFLPKVKVEVVVLDEDLGKTLNTIVTRARTGERGDGKVFVLPIENAIRVRTGEVNESAV
jgi:nitrogen regulatory protein P-II 1